MAPGDHLCLLSGDHAERQQVLSLFIEQGLAREERVLYYFADSAHAAKVCGFLEQELWRRQLPSGQLTIASAEEVYLAGGDFHAARAIDALRQQATAAVAAGWQGLRVTGDMTWALRGGLAAHRLIAYETELHAAISDLPVTVICEYDQRQSDRNVANQLLRSHNGRVGVDPWRHAGSMRVFHMFEPPGIRVEGSVDATTKAAFADALSQAVGRADENGDTHVDMGELKFIDLDGLRELVWAATQLPEGRRLVLRRLAPQHRDLIILLRWDELPELRLDEGRSS